jgi:hypothetical protein
MFFNEALCKYIEWISEDLAFVIFFKLFSHFFRSAETSINRQNRGLTRQKATSTLSILISPSPIVSKNNR